MVNHAGATLLVVAGLLLVSLAVPATAASSTNYLTTTLVQSGVTQTTINGFPGVLVNYTNSLTVSLNTFIYLDLVNSVGQTVYWNVETCIFASIQKVQCFVPITPTLPSGTYSARVFATSSTYVALSTTTTLVVSL
jgi:hypothetical protein